MKYYEVAAKWWSEQLCSLEEHKFDNKYISLAQNFEKVLSEFIKEEVEKEEYLMLSSNNISNAFFAKVARIIGLNIKKIPEKITMFIRPYNVTVTKGNAGNFDVLYLESN